MTDPAAPVRAVLWDADGVLQQTPARCWDPAVRVVEQVPGAFTGALIDEASIRAGATGLGLGDRIADILSVWSTFHVPAAGLEVIAQVRAGGVPCYLATNQDVFRATRMRERAPYGERLDGAYYSCDLGVAKPSVDFFEHIVTDLGLASSDLLFVDDQAANVAGARPAGLRAERWTQTDGITRLRELLAAHGL